MTKEDFTLEAALRLIVLEPDSPEKVARIARELANEVFKTELDYKRIEFENTSIQHVLDIIHPKSTPLKKFFENNSITTIGDMIKLGKSTIRNIRGVGYIRFCQIYDLLVDNGIEDW